MVSRNRAALVAQRIEALAYSGLASADLRVAFAGALSAAVPFEAAFLPSADPATLLYTGAVRIGMPDGVTPQFIENEFNTPDVNKFRDLTRCRAAVATLDRSTGGNWMASPRYRDIMRPNGLGDELRAVFRTGTTTWGYACLHRAHGPVFDAQEIALVERVAPHIAEGLRRALLIDQAVNEASDDGPGIVTLSPDMTVAAATPAGARWLDELAQTEQPPSHSVPIAVLAVAQALRHLENTERTPRLTVRSASGRWLVLHAAHLASAQETSIAVIIEPATGAELEPTLVAAYGLTPREAAALTLLVRGLSTKQIAAALLISIHTANDHIKSIFHKTGVGSRGELLATTLHGLARPTP